MTTSDEADDGVMNNNLTFEIMVTEHLNGRHHMPAAHRRTRRLTTPTLRRQ